MVEFGGNDRDWEFHLRSLAQNSREASTVSDPSIDAELYQYVKILHKMCKDESSGDLVARIYPQMSRVFQRSLNSTTQNQPSNGLLLLAILQYFLDFGESVLHPADDSLQSFFRSCLSRQFADPAIAEATLAFLSQNKHKIFSSFSNLLPQFFPLLLKLIAWHGERLGKQFLMIFTGMMAPTSFLPLFPSIVDLPILVLALEKVEKSSGSLIGSGIASIQKSAAPEMLLALMDEAYTGSTIGDLGAGSGNDHANSIDAADAEFLDLLKDENDGLTERHWTSGGMFPSLQAAIGGPQSDRLKQSLRMVPRLFDVYFAIALRDVNNSLVCALIPLVMARYATLYPDKTFAAEVQKRLLEFILVAFQRSPEIVATLKKPIIDRLGEVYDSTAKTELALQLCWAIGEHGGGGFDCKDAARELFESLELLLYENIAASRIASGMEIGFGFDAGAFRRSSRVRLLCFVVTAIAKLAAYHKELLPRARVSLSKVARSHTTLDSRVWKRAHDYLRLFDEPAIYLSILGPASGCSQGSGIINWSDGGSKMIAHIPFYILAEKEGPPFHDFSMSEVFPDE